MTTEIQTTAQDNTPAIVEQTNTLTAWATSLVITSAAECEDALMRLKQIKTACKSASDEKEHHYRPLKIAIDRLNDRFNPLIKALESAEKVVRQKAAEYQFAVQQEQRRKEEAERKAREEEALRQRKEAEDKARAEAERVKADAEARAAELRQTGQVELADAVQNQAAQGAQDIVAAAEKATDELFTAASTIVEVAKTTKTEAGAFTVRAVWDFELVDISKVPAEYLQLDTAKVRAAVGSGSRDISGLRIFEKPQGSMK